MCRVKFVISRFRMAHSLTKRHFFVLADFELSNDDDDEEEDEEEDASEDFGHSDEDDFNPFGSGSDSEEVRIPHLSVKPIKQ